MHLKYVLQFPCEANLRENEPNVHPTTLLNSTSWRNSEIRRSRGSVTGGYVFGNVFFASVILTHGISFVMTTRNYHIELTIPLLSCWIMFTFPVLDGMSVFLCCM